MHLTNTRINTRRIRVYILSYCPEYEIDIDGIKQNALCFTKHLYWMHVAHILRQNDRKMIQTFPIYSISLFIQNRFIITPCLDR